MEQDEQKGLSFSGKSDFETNEKHADVVIHGSYNSSSLITALRAQYRGDGNNPETIKWKSTITILKPRQTQETELDISAGLIFSEFPQQGFTGSWNHKVVNHEEVNFVILYQFISVV